MLECRNLTKRFPGVVALRDVTLHVARGEFHAVVGENGAGKSTLMKILAGVLDDYQGEVRLRGQVVRFASTRDAEAAGIRMIHQELNLVEQLSVAANIFLGREPRRRLGLLDHRAMHLQAARLLRQLECHVRPDEPVGRLRVGDQQLVEIAKALALRAELLIMDEPTSALTEAEADRLFRVVEQLRRSGVTILYISHKMDEVFRLADRITVLRDGQHVATLRRAETTPREVTHLMVGREIEQLHFGGQRARGEPVLRVERLWLPWPGHARQWRLRDISFTLHRGEVLGIAGLMGAGRTELLECLFGASPVPPLGRVFVQQREVCLAHPADAARLGIALVTEDRKRLGLFSHLTVRDNITLCTLHEAVRGGLLSRRAETQLAQQAVHELGIRARSVEAPVTTLSGGNQQKCILARWLRTRPQVLLLDDPTRGVDVGAKAELYQIIDQLCRAGRGIVLTSSELPELITLCDRILVLCEGRVTGHFARPQFNEQAIMEAATARLPESAA
jgi:ribose transport system ATP-binding protein